MLPESGRAQKQDSGLEIKCCLASHSVTWEASFPTSKGLLQNEKMDKVPACSRLCSRLNSQRCADFPSLMSRRCSLLEPR